MIGPFKAEYRFLSNFWLCTIEHEGVQYISVEHAYQAAKTHDPQWKEEIRKAATAGIAKRLGNRAPLRAGWELDKIQVMKDLLRKKFENPVLAHSLLQTGNHQLVELNSWGDTFWGVCAGIGKNKLGQLLMEIRAELQPQQGGAQ